MHQNAGWVWGTQAAFTLVIQANYLAKVIKYLLWGGEEESNSRLQITCAFCVWKTDCSKNV